ncbi:unnamed protein product [Dicrocoelium dendriticum]|nr:unnamed protein product [Dicrocoelium dendriticum]
MTSAEDLKRALLTNLERSGHLKRLKAELLENVFMSLDKSYWSSAGRSSPYIPENPVSDYKFIILELLMEFLAFEHLEFSQSVLRAESGHGDLNISRQTLCQMLGIRPTVKVKPLDSDGVRQSRLDRSAAPQVNSPVPILYYLVDRFKRGYVADSYKREPPRDFGNALFTSAMGSAKKYANKVC